MPQRRIMKRRKIIPYNPWLKQLARNLRNDSTKSEVKLWLELRTKKMMGYDFHRQKPLDNFIADFFCHELMLVIELDGYSHTFEEVIKKDEIKTKKLEERGLTVLRFPDSDIFNDINNVLRVITNYILDYEERHPPMKNNTPDPSQEGRFKVPS
jgi:very-short-patch-repair endonuclease